MTYSPRTYGWKAMRRQRDRDRAVLVLLYVGLPLLALAVWLATR